MTNPNLMDDGDVDSKLSITLKFVKLTLVGWGNPIGQSNDAPIKNSGGGDGWGNTGGGEPDPDAAWNNGGQADGDNMGGAPQGKGMLDERMSEGTGLISNEFQVEVSLFPIDRNT
jgi:hypothetical protein